MASTSTATNSTSRIEEKVVAKQMQTKSLKMNGWTKFTPATTGTVINASSTSVWKYRVYDNTLEVQGFISRTGAAAGTSTATPYTFGFPSGATSVVASLTTAPLSIGAWSFSVGGSGTAGFVGTVLLNDSISVACAYVPNAAAGTDLWTAFGDASATKISNAGGSTFSLTYRVELDPACALLAGTQ